MKRKGETLTEFLTAVTVFGLMAAGIFEFIANQTENLADIKNKDDMMYGAQVICNWTLNKDVEGADGSNVTLRNHSILHNIDHDVEKGNNHTYYYRNKDTGSDPEIKAITISDGSCIPIMEAIISFDWDKKTHTLTVTKYGQSLSFQLQP